MSAAVLEASYELLHTGPDALSHMVLNMFVSEVQRSAATVLSEQMLMTEPTYA